MNEERLEKFIDQIKEGIARNDADLTDPDDDFAPMMFALKPCEDPKGHDHAEWDEGEPPYYDFGLIYLDSEFLNHKDMLTQEIMPKVLEQVEAVTAAYLSSTWIVRPDDTWPKEMVDLTMQLAPSDHPWRSEALMLLVVSGNPQQDQMHMIDLHRDDRKVPYLDDEWRLIVQGPETGDRFEGRFYTALVRGVRGSAATP